MNGDGGLMMVVDVVLMVWGCGQWGLHRWARWIGSVMKMGCCCEREIGCQMGEQFGVRDGGEVVKGRYVQVWGNVAIGLLFLTFHSFSRFSHTRAHAF